MKTQFSFDTLKEVLTSIANGEGTFPEDSEADCVDEDLAIRSGGALFRFLDKGMTNLFQTFPEIEKAECEQMMKDLKWIPCLPPGIPWVLTDTVVLSKGALTQISLTYEP